MSNVNDRNNVGSGENANVEPPHENVVELEFELAGTESFLVQLSEHTECTFRLEEVLQRSDGSVLEFLSVRGADPEQVLALAREEPGVQRARMLTVDGEEALFEFVSESHLATALADEECTYTHVTATAGNGRVVAEVPPHVDATAVIDAFLEQYPNASLRARRVTDRAAPMLTRTQLRSEVVSALTDKQLQALRTAHAVGYFDWPRNRTAAEVADELGVTTPTFAQHLRVAERKIFDELFRE